MTTTTATISGRRRTVETEARPCRGCGLIVRHPDPARAETLRIFTNRGGRPGMQTIETEIPVTRCDVCAARRDLAAELLAAHPRVAAALGDFGLDQLDGALAALDLRGFRPRRAAETLVKSDAELLELLAALLPVGAAIVWSERYAFSGGQAKRWGHVSPELARDAGEAYRELVHYSVETPMPYAPPDRDGALRGCLFCGVGHITLRRRDALAAWGDLQIVHPGELGGQTRPEPVAGYFCPACRGSIEGGGAPGLPAVERALLSYASGVKRVNGYRLNMPSNARAWVALPPGTAPNRTPWAHVNLAQMRADLADLEQRGIVRRPWPGEPR